MHIQFGSPRGTRRRYIIYKKHESNIITLCFSCQVFLSVFCFSIFTSYYIRLLSGKKTAYAEYRKLRDEAQELVIAEANIRSLYDAERKEVQEQQKEENRL